MLLSVHNLDWLVNRVFLVLRFIVLVIDLIAIHVMELTAALWMLRHRLNILDLMLMIGVAWLITVNLMRRTHGRSRYKHSMLLMMLRLNKLCWSKGLRSHNLRLWLQSHSLFVQLAELVLQGPERLGCRCLFYRMLHCHHRCFQRIDIVLNWILLLLYQIIIFIIWFYNYFILLI